MTGAKSGRRRQQHHIHAAVDNLLIRVQADETFLRVDLHSLGMGLLEIPEASLDFSSNASPIATSTTFWSAVSA